MNLFDIGLINANVYINGTFIKANVYIKNEKIWDISSSILESKEIYDVNERMVLPGFIDPHVHFKLRVGKFESVDDFETGSISCAYGGITTFIDFLDPVKDTDELEKTFNNRMRLAVNSLTDYSFHTTIANPRDPLNIVKKSKELGISSIKLFTTYSSSKRMTSDEKIALLMKNSKKYGYVVSIHAENDNLVKESERDDLSIIGYPDSRPTIAEASEVMKLAQMSEFYNSQTYVVHLSSGYTLAELRKRYIDILNKNLVIESCPHYFVFNKKLMKDKHGGLYAMCPPLRSERERKLLIDNFHIIRTIGTDHCPFKRRDKLKKYIKDIPMGIGGVEFSFILMYTLFGEGAIDKFTSNVADTFGLKYKGRILPGYDADIVIFDPSVEWGINGHHSRSDYNPYHGFKVKGKIVSTMVRGKFVMKEGKLIAKKGYGIFQKRKDTIW